MADPASVEDAFRRAQTSFCALPIAAAQASAEMRYLWVSDQYADWLGVPREELVGGDGRPVAVAADAERDVGNALALAGDESISHVLHSFQMTIGR